MRKFGSVDEVLDFAIEKEEEAAEFYSDLAGRVKSPSMAQTLQELSKMELGHKEKLLGVKEGKTLLPAQEKVMDLKISDYLVDVEPTEEMDIQDALTIAMKKEKAAYKLYTALAGATDNENLRNTMEALAQEEAKHKLGLEILYDDYILIED